MKKEKIRWWDETENVDYEVGILCGNVIESTIADAHRFWFFFFCFAIHLLTHITPEDEQRKRKCLTVSLDFSYTTEEKRRKKYFFLCWCFIQHNKILFFIEIGVIIAWKWIKLVFMVKKLRDTMTIALAKWYVIACAQLNVSVFVFLLLLHMGH